MPREILRNLIVESAAPKFSRGEDQFDRMPLNPNVIGGGARLAQPSDSAVSTFDHLKPVPLDDETRPCSQRASLHDQRTRGELAARRVKSYGGKPLASINRALERARKLGEKVRSKRVPLTDQIPEPTAAFAATGDLA